LPGLGQETAQRYS